MRSSKEVYLLIVIAALLHGAAKCGRTGSKSDCNEDCDDDDGVKSAANELVARSKATEVPAWLLSPSWAARQHTGSNMASLMAQPSNEVGDDDLGTSKSPQKGRQSERKKNRTYKKFKSSNIKPSKKQQFEQVKVDKQNQVSNFSDVRTQTQSGFTRKRQKGLHKMLDQLFGRLLGVQPSNEKGTMGEFAQYALSDRSNDHLAMATTQELIVQAGYKYENHYVESTDGYITQLIRIINPLADPSKLKQPPVMLFHGGTVDTSIYSICSTIQHHPEHWPRSEDNWRPMTSWNRSLSFVLANNGYDVWLVGTRGATRANQGHRRIKRQWPTNTDTADDWYDTNMEHAVEYWSNASYDDIIEQEMPQQIDRVMQLTNSKKVSIVSLSMSTPTTMGLLASRPEYSRKVRNFVIIDPLLSERNSNNMMKMFYRTLCTTLTDEEGAMLISEFVFSSPIRDIQRAISDSRTLRYTLLKTILNLTFGPSPKFSSLLELNLMSHLGAQVGYRQLKQMCQILMANRVQHYDHGPMNLLKYQSLLPPPYDMSQMKPDNWLIVSAEHDAFSSKQDVEQLIQTVPKRPYRYVFMPNANHLDLIAHVQIDTLVNLPILEFMDKFSYAPGDEGYTSGYVSRSPEDEQDRSLKKFVPPDNRDPDGAAILEAHRRRDFGSPPSAYMVTQ